MIATLESEAIGAITPKDVKAATFGAAKDDNFQRILLSELFVDQYWNCRGPVVPFDVLELQQAIYENGLDQPVIARPLPESLAKQLKKKYQLVAGFRRTKCFELLHKEHPDQKQWEAIPTKVKELSDVEAAVQNLTENIQRKDLTHYQEAMGLKKFIDLGFREDYIARLIGKPTRWVSARKRILDLEPEIQEAINSGFLNIKQIERLCKLPSPDKRYAFVRQAKDHAAAGEKIVVDKKRTPKNVKKPRDRAAMNKMLDFVWTQLGPSLATRLLAWAVGNVDTNEVENELKMLISLEKGDLFVHTIEWPEF